jgi:hypothetical protein
MIDSFREREKPANGSERSFSLVFAIVFGIIAGWTLASGGAPRFWAFAVALVFPILGSGEYKVMGLAPYGEPRFKNLILDNIVDLKPDGTFRLDQSYFNYCTGLTMTNGRFSDLLGKPVRKPETELLSQFHMDVAASIQAVTNEILLHLTRSLAQERLPNLCLAGGVALNCVANGKILRNGAFRDIWIQPAAGDAGGAVLAVWHTELGKPRVAGRDRMAGACLGPSFSDAEIAARLKAAGAFRYRFRGRRRRSHGRRARRRQGGRLVPSAHGIRPAGAWQPLDPRRPALADHAEDAEPQGQVSRILPPLRAVGAARGCRGNRGSGKQSALSRAVVRLQGAHRLRLAGQYFLQCARRAHRVHARGRVPLLHGNRHRRPRLRQCISGKIRARPIAASNLQGPLSA